MARRGDSRDGANVLRFLDLDDEQMTTLNEACEEGPSKDTQDLLSKEAIESYNKWKGASYKEACKMPTREELEEIMERAIK